MKYQRKISGGIVVTIGYILSPLSWWNDLFVNIPIAYAFGWLASLISKSAFLPVFIVSYWLTNIAGLIMLHKGIQRMAAKEDGKTTYSAKGLMRDIVLSLIYTGVIIILVKLGMLKPAESYLK
jgi:hypothetical protein